MFMNSASGSTYTSWRKTFHVVSEYCICRRTCCRKGWRRVEKRLPPHLHCTVVYFAADPWIFNMKTTYPLYSSTVDLQCKGIIVCIEYQSFCPFVGIGSPPIPSPASDCVSSPPTSARIVSDTENIGLKDYRQGEALNFGSSVGQSRRMARVWQQPRGGEDFLEGGETSVGGKGPPLSEEKKVSN
jgi:hypothetical protein